MSLGTRTPVEICADAVFALARTKVGCHLGEEQTWISSFFFVENDTKVIYLLQQRSEKTQPNLGQNLMGFLLKPGTKAKTVRF